jgi:hypothetical protein
MFVASDSCREFLQQTYLDNFNPVEDYHPGKFWHRYRSLEHVQGWSQLITRFLPDVLERVARMDPQTINIGSEIDLDTNPLRPR